MEWLTTPTGGDGRHLSMMPHPERVTIPWQWPWVPPEWESLETSP